MVKLLTPRKIATQKTQLLHATLWLRNMRLMDAVFRALADVNRRKLLDRLYERNGQTLGDLCEELMLIMTRQEVTKHLQLLERANLIATVWQGRDKLHYLNPLPILDIEERWIRKYQHHQLKALLQLKTRTENETNGKA